MRRSALLAFVAVPCVVTACRFERIQEHNERQWQVPVVASRRERIERREIPDCAYPERRQSQRAPIPNGANPKGRQSQRAPIPKGADS